MNKYEHILNRIQEEYKKATPLEDLYIMGMCHAIQSIVINDNTIDHKTAKEIDTKCQALIDEIIGRI